MVIQQLRLTYACAVKDFTASDMDTYCIGATLQSTTQDLTVAKINLVLFAIDFVLSQPETYTCANAYSQTT